MMDNMKKYGIIGGAFFVLATHLMFLFIEGSEKAFFYHNIFMILVGGVLIYLAFKK